MYATDDVLGEHVRRSAPEDTPYLQRFVAVDMDERWVNRSPVTMLETFHWYRGEAGLIRAGLIRASGRTFGHPDARIVRIYRDAIGPNVVGGASDGTPTSSGDGPGQ